MGLLSKGKPNLEKNVKERARKRASSQKQGEREGKCNSHPIEQGTSHPVSNYFPNGNIDELALVS